MRAYICEGKKKTMAQGTSYLVDANSNAAAHGLAGQLYKESIGGPYPREFYAMYFDVRVAKPKLPGKPSQKILPKMEEVPA